MTQRYFINSWLLPCSLHSHRTANPRPKMASLFLGFTPPTTQIQVDTRKKYSEITTGQRRGKLTKKIQFCKLKQ